MREQDPVPPLAEVLAATRVVAIPTRTRFRGITVREAAILDAPQGASEFSPFPEYGDAEASAWLAAALDFGWAEQPPVLRERIEVNATVPAVPAAEVPAILSRFPGCRTAKVKVAERGQSLADDVARVRAVREALGPEARVRVDANGGWTVTEAATALRALAEFELDYAEQPCATVAELAEVRRQTRGQVAGDSGSAPTVRIAADESVRKAADPLAVARAGAADLLIVKAQPLGGVRRALSIVAEAGLPVVVSSALDTSAGIAMGLRLASALPEGLLAGACGLGTVALLDGDVTADPLLPREGSIAVRRPALDGAALDRFAAPPERKRWWRERIARCHALLAAPARRPHQR
ncbi:o-succinylbenzoate synthase [Leucobacter massiliensis]|uniref:o-succinylbenzoate synthase n=1 Tax=Leucobacter massiliensis TaxID=1686285 RepID=A0A2S9QN84_9MICO|nr:o-succinylbenzoate synthase [Leucobacter massiliensis]PRI11047.1 O-succinylbenzoate synthase [Leucobacter massiliensis]